MLTAMNGTFRNGRVELEKDPGIVGEVAVVVTFLEPGASPVQTTESKPITFGMLAEPGRQMSNEGDFKIAEHNDESWDDKAAQ